MPYTFNARDLDGPHIIDCRINCVHSFDWIPLLG